MKDVITYMAAWTTKEVSDSEHKDNCQEFCERFKSICKCEIGHFRLQIMMELLGLSGLVSEEMDGLRVTDSVYPVKALGSYKHLSENGVEPGDDMISMIEIIGQKLGINRRAYVENLICEARPEQNQVWDVFFESQRLYILKIEAVSGNLMVHKKRYGEQEWILATIDF